MKKYHVYGVGNALVDMEFEVEDSFFQSNGIDKGVMTLVDEDRQHELMGHLDAFDGKKASGGSAANTIIATSYFGGKSFYSCKVANDELGDFYVNDLQEAGVDSNVGDGRKDGITGKCLVMITPDAERTMNTYLGITANFSVDELHLSAIKDSEYLYIEGYLVSSETGRHAAIEARKVAEENGVKTALTFSDPAMVQFFKDGLKEMIGNKVDLLFCNEAEAMSWSDTDNLESAVESLKQIASTFAITQGSEGATLFDGKNMIEISPHDVKAVDSNGAGDMFAGAFLYGITHGHSFYEAGNIASLAAAKVVSQFGPRLAASEHKEILDIVQG
ncbi:MAG: adenosine kinase [endosymbiont of Galathealinum brachiosum]|uniref:Adenosine kinase n=1 Tax=endosymbiont of Galathealinum brachiosum TaxID=2200906 RepID=A0A370DJA1_9GAMM|nr:MAG: adenosine kinase [endosymbiont of Galathealinum brachiosum]